MGKRVTAVVEMVTAQLRAVAGFVTRVVAAVALGLVINVWAWVWLWFFWLGCFFWRWLGLGDGCAADMDGWLVVFG